MQMWLKQNWLSVLAIVLALLALGTFPYVYYQIMNWVLVFAALTVAWRAKKMQKELIMWLFVAVAVVFNPITPLYLRQDIWRALDIVVAVLFVYSFVFFKTARK